MSQVIVHTSIDTQKKEMTTGEFLGFVLDHYDNLEDRLLAKIVESSDNDTLEDPQAFRSHLKNLINEE